MQLPGRLGDFATGRRETESAGLSSSLNYLDLVVKVDDRVAPARFGSAPRRFGTPPGQTETGEPLPGAVAAPETKVTGEPLPSAAGAAVKSETLPLDKTEKGGLVPAAAAPQAKMFDFESADTYRPIAEKPPMPAPECNGYLDCAGAWAAGQVMNRLFK